MASCGGDLEHPPRTLLAADVREVGSRRHPIGSRQRGRRRWVAVTAEIGDCLREVAHRNRVDPGESDLRAGFRRAHEALSAVAPCAFGGHERSRHGPQAPIESELADCGVASEGVGWDLPRCREHGERDRQVESRPLLAKVGGREVDGDPPQWPLELRRGNATPNPLLCLLTGPVGQTDNRKARQAVLKVRLDFDPAWVEADESVGDRASEDVVSLDN